MPGQGIDAGDAIVSFLADTTQLDAAFNRVGGEATVKMGAATAAVEGTTAAVKDLGAEMAVGQRGAVELGEVTDLAGKEMKASMYEARGEIALLGEETGIRLPRHLRSFVAELPGVGAALTSAFQATAVLFLLQILAEATGKVSEFAAEVIYGSKAADQEMESTKELNKHLLAAHELYVKLTKEISEYGKNAVQLAQLNEGQAKQSIAELTKQLGEEEAELKSLDETMKSHVRTTIGISEAYKMYKAGALGFVEALTAITVGETQAVLKAKEHEELQGKLTATTKDLTNSKLQEVVAHHKTTEEVAKYNAEMAKYRERIANAYDEMYKLNREIEKNAHIMASEMEPEMSETAAAVMRLGSALRLLGHDTVDLEAQQRNEAKALSLVYEGYQKGTVTLTVYQQARLHELQTERDLAAARNQSTVALDKEIAALKRSLNMDQEQVRGLEKLNREEKIFQQVLHNTGSVAQATGEVMGQAMGAAVAAYAMGGQSIAASLQKMAQAEIASIAQRSTVKAIEELAAGFATMFTNPAESGGHFTSAALYGSIAAAATVAGAAMTPGGASSGGGSGYPGAANSLASPSTTIGTVGGPTTTTRVQKFATGGLIDGPTLAMMGEAGGGKREAAIPLDDPAAVSAIVKALGGGGGPTQHYHIKGLISPDNMRKVIKQQNEMVRNNHARVVSSNSYRVTRRSQ